MTVSIAPSGAASETERITARETTYHLSAALFGYPLAETQQALEDGRLHAALAPAWELLTGKLWPMQPASPDLAALEVGYMATFVHGRRGKPRVPLVGSAYDALLNGLTPGSYLLNVQAFYRHFGLQAALGDEGLQDEPDHLVSMLEFCALLCHLERQAIENATDPAPYQRAQRDFIARYLGPLLHTVRERFAKERDQGLDATLAQLVNVLPDWAEAQQTALVSLVGPCPSPRTAGTHSAASAEGMWD